MRIRKIIHYGSRYGCTNDGGGLRHRQIKEILAQYIAVSNTGKEEIKLETNTPLSSSLRQEGLRLVLWLLPFIISFPFITLSILSRSFGNASLIQLLIAARSFSYWSKKIKVSKPRMFVTEDVFYDIGGVLAHKASGVPIIAIPHNIDSLCHVGWIKNKAGVRDNMGNLSLEISLLMLCAKVFTISKSDMLFLRTIGVSADLLPYHPDSLREKELLKTRQARELYLKNLKNNTNHLELLVAGSTHNPLTEEGMQKLLLNLKEVLRISEKKFIIHFTGKFTPEESSENFKYHGYLNMGDYLVLTSRVAAMIVHQERGSGVLTRIKDALISGIPVFASSVASRSWDVLPGVYVYEDNILDLITSSHSLPFLAPLPPQTDGAISSSAPFKILAEEISRHINES
jgi:hypothetical protein